MSKDESVASLSRVPTKPVRVLRTKRYGWLPDLPDQRDFKFSEHHQPLVSPPQLPAAVDLSASFSRVEDQGELGSCTANAIVGNLEFLEKITDHTPTNLSRLFVYYNERYLENSVAEDSGAFIRDGVKSLLTWGVCSEIMLPYRVASFAQRPSQSCFTSALRRRISKYLRLDGSLQQMKQCLADGFPFVFGFTVYDSFESPQMSASGLMQMPATDEQVLGGHAVCAAGYMDNSELSSKGMQEGEGGGRLIVRNSWGNRWGKAGYFFMPYAYATNRDLCDDFWTIRK